MPIALPLTLLGIGVLVYLLFVSASHALPLAVALAATFAARDAGASVGIVALIAVATFMGVTALAHFLIRTLPGRTAAHTIPIMFAVPAGFAGYAVAHGMASLAGFSSGVTALIIAVLVGLMAFRRFQTQHA